MTIQENYFQSINDNTELQKEKLDFNNFSFKNSIKLNGVLNKKYLKKVSLGNNHCLFLTHAGMAFSIGDNSRGQLGIGNIITQKDPIMITALLNYRITDISAGEFHNIAIGYLRDNTNSKIKIEENLKNKENYVFSWGDNKYGQLGIGYQNARKEFLENNNDLKKSIINYDNKENNEKNLNNNFLDFINTPKIISFFTNKLVSSFEVGLNHNIFYLMDTKIYAFGSNLNHQILYDLSKLQFIY